MPQWCDRIWNLLTDWGLLTHVCVSKSTTIGSYNGLSPAAPNHYPGILIIRTSDPNFNEIITENHTFSFKKMHVKTSSAKWRLFLSWPQCVNESNKGKAISNRVHVSLAALQTVIVPSLPQLTVIWQLLIERDVLGMSSPGTLAI